MTNQELIKLHESGILTAMEAIEKDCFNRGCEVGYLRGDSWDKENEDKLITFSDIDDDELADRLIYDHIQKVLFIGSLEGWKDENWHLLPEGGEFKETDSYFLEGEE